MNYGEEKSLTDILVELSQYCYSVSGKETKLKLTLPIEVLDQYTRRVIPKERIKLFGSVQEIEPDVIKTLYTGFGTIEFITESET